MKLALVFGMRLFAGRPPREMVEIARIADELGFDYVCLAEHVLMHGQPDLAAHTFGPPRHSPDELMPEPLTTLAAMAGATERIGLLTGILIAPLRPAALLAKTAATLHALSDGRLTLGGQHELAARGVRRAQRAVRGPWPATGRDAAGVQSAVERRADNVRVTQRAVRQHVARAQASQR